MLEQLHYSLLFRWFVGFSPNDPILGIIDERLPAKDPKSNTIKEQVKQLQLKQMR